MANFKTCVREQSADGLYNVYVRITHNRRVGYIRTSQRITPKSLNKEGNVVDNSVILKCSRLIESFSKKLNEVSNISTWKVTEIIEFLKKSDESISFTKFAEVYINRMKNENRTNTAGNYKNAITSLCGYLGKESFNFSDLTKKNVEGWISSLSKTKRARNLYPTCIKAIFQAGMKEYNDCDREIIKIKNQPFEGVVIPPNGLPEKKAVANKIISRIFQCQPVGKRAEIAKDVAFLIFCLAGINTADLYDLKKENLKDWKLCYQRKKTRDKRLDNAYIEITVPEIVRPVFEKYKGQKRLFLFSERYATANDFNKYMNKGLKSICEKLGVPPITTYTFRHTWATIAQNECNVSIEDIAFSLNHVSAHKVTNGYIRPDYSRIDKINQKVINKVLKKQNSKSV